MKIIKLEKSLQKIQRQLDNMVQDEGKPSALDVDYIKRLTIQFYDKLNSLELEPQDVSPTHQIVRESKSEIEEAQSSLTKFDREVEIVAKSIEIPSQEPILSVEAEDEDESMDPKSVDLLFAIPSGTDLSDILSNRPIDHISDSMGFNERIYTINELFDGDKDYFNTLVDKLHVLNDFDEAKEVLKREVIMRYNWLNEHRLKKAQTFLRHIQRKYQALPV